VEDKGSLVILTPERFSTSNPAHVELAHQVAEQLARAELLGPMRPWDGTPQRATHRWIRFDPAPPEATLFEIHKQAENTPAAIQLAQNEITPRILRREPLVLDFTGLRILTQSYLHSLLFEPLRLAWALRIPIYVRNVEPAVRSNLELLENYALAG
jgi:hypothetical protein